MMQILHHRLLSWLWISAICLLTGCTATNDVIRLGYTPLSKPEVIKEAEGITVQVNAIDVRRNTSDIGKKVNEVNWSGVISVENELAVLVAKAFDTELSRRGFKIGSGSVWVSAEINKFVNEFSGVPLEAVGEVILTVRVKKAAGTQVHSRQVKGGSYIKSKTRTGKYAKIALETALTDAMRQLMSDPSIIDAIFEASGKSSVGTHSQSTK